MDDFRDVSLGDCDVYVIDSVTGHTKAVVDRFYSLIWTERFAEAGEFELSGPEDTVWAGVIAEGDYLHFTASGTGTGGRYTMVVESRYTTWDADNGYTVFANGRSLESLLDRRINLGLTKFDKTDWKHYEEFKWYAYSTTGQPDPMDMSTWPHKRNMTGDRDEYLDYSDEYVVTPMVIQSIDSGTTPKGSSITTAIYNLIECNMGPSAKESRQFGDTFDVYDPKSWLRDDEKHRQISIANPYYADEPIDGRFENLYDLITDLLSQTDRYRNALGLRLTGEMRQVSQGSAETVFHMTFEVWQGRDLTIDNNMGNDPVIFAKDWDNAITLEYVHGEANLKNSLFYDTGLLYTPADIYELEQLISSIDLENQAIQIEMNYPEPPELPQRGDYDDDYDYQEAMEQYNEALENYQDQMRRLGQLKAKMDKQVTRLEREIRTRDEELARPGLSEDDRKKLNDRKAEDQTRLDKLRHRRGQINENHEFKVPDNADEGTKKSLERKEKERQKALKSEKEGLDELNKTFTARKERLEKEDDNQGYEEPYYGTYGRDYANPAWTNVAWSDADQGPIGFDRREMYYKNDPVDWMSQRWTGRFGEYRYDTDDDGNEIAWYPDWNYYCETMHQTARTELKKDENSREDTLEATVNYNVMFKPTVDYDVGDRVTVMGIWNNETVREMRCKEMVYSVDSSGFTVVPSFTLLEENKGA